MGDRTAADARLAGAPEVHTAFDTAHPAVPALYLALTLALTMFCAQPVLVACSLAGAVLFVAATQGWHAVGDGLRWQLPVIVIIALFNPLFSASGSTEIARFGQRAVYLESLAYGACMGGLLVASMLWLKAASCLLSFDKVMALFGNAVPVVSLMISMSMRLIPRFVRKAHQVLAAQDAVDLPRETRWDRLRQRLRLSSVLMGWGMEDSLETADAMRARGWGAATRRTTYTRYAFRGADLCSLLALAVGGLVVALLAYAACSQFEFYPRLSTLVPWWGYVVYMGWMLVPSVLHVVERRRFQ